MVGPIYFQLHEGCSDDVVTSPIGIWTTVDTSITDGMIKDWYKSYVDSDVYELEDFEDYVKTNTGYEIERVYLENVFVGGL